MHHNAVFDSDLLDLASLRIAFRCGSQSTKSDQPGQEEELFFVCVFVFFVCFQGQK